MIVHQVENEQAGRTEIRHKQYGEDRWGESRFRPYFYVSADEGYSLPDGVGGRVVRGVEERAYDGTELHKVVLDSTRGAKDARAAAENHYEADIPFERRYYIDKVEEDLFGDGDIADERPHIAHVDIEVDVSGGALDAMEAEAPVVSVSVYSEQYDSHTDLLLKPDGWDPDSRVDDKNREYVEPGWAGERGSKVYLFDTEQGLLGALCRIIRRGGVEVLTGWNFEEFDAVYLINRLAAVDGVSESALSPLKESYASRWESESGAEHTSATIKGIDIVDMMEAYKHFKRRDKPPNWRLGTAAEYEGADVEKMDVDASRAGEVWREDPLRLMEYNRRDAYLTHLIDQQLDIFDQLLTFHRELAVPLPDTLNNSVLVEMFVMSRSPDWGLEERILDSKRDPDETNDFEGGNTKQPNEGLYEWVFSADVTSEYPNWVRAANISPETAVTPGDPEWGRDDLIETPDVEDGDLSVKFLPHGERLGILPRAVDEMFELKRRKTEKRAQHEYGTDGYEQADMERDGTKWLLNSIQGVTGMETHRLSKNEVSAAITAFGRETVEKMVDVGEALGHEFVYGDTDSVFMHDPSGEVCDTDSAVEAVGALAERTNGVLPEWASEEFGITDKRRENLEVEPEKVAKRAFFPNKKKRYTLWLVWNDGQDADKITHTGWAIVRSDTSELEETVQRKTLEALMHGYGEGYITEHLREEANGVLNGEYDPIGLARPQGSAKAFDRYGGDDGRLTLDGVPYFVAAMLSSNALLGTNYQGGDKTWLLPVDTDKRVGVVRGEVVEIDASGAAVSGGGRADSTNDVNYLAIEEDTELPDWARINYGKVIDNMIGKVERIYESMGWDLTLLKEKRAAAKTAAEVERKQAVNQTLGGFST